MSMDIWGCRLCFLRAPVLPTLVASAGVSSAAALMCRSDSRSTVREKPNVAFSFARTKSNELMI
jgi:hypothetical protein